MNKRITSLLLCLVMVFTMLATAVPVFAAGADEITVTPSKTEANPGDTITYTVTVGKVSTLGMLELCLSAPEGLTLVSATMSTEVKLSEDYDSGFFQLQEGKVHTMINFDLDGYTGTNDFVIGTFVCTVDASASGTLKIVNTKQAITDDFGDDKEMTVNVDASAINVTPKPIPATSVDITEATLSLKTGENATLHATVNPNTSTDAVVWSSSNPDIATVNSSTGVVTAASSIAPNISASVLITATAGTKTDTCAVTVNCAHSSLTPTAAKTDADCQHQNYSAYWTCNACGQKFSDVAGTAEIYAIPYTGYGAHNYSSSWTDGNDGKHYHVCTVEGCGEKNNAAAHVYGGGESDMFCDDCGHDRTHHCGGGIKVNASPANCSTCTDGNIEYYECSCGKKYDNALCNGTALTDVTVPWEHTLQHVAADTYCYKEGIAEHWHCTSCNENYAANDDRATTAMASTTAPATGIHTWGTAWVDGGDGKHYHECTVEGCTAKDDSTKADHNWDAGVQTKAPTCTVAGIRKHTCADCGVTKNESISMISHDYQPNHDTTNHWDECSMCHDKQNVAAHIFDNDEDMICDICSYDRTHVCKNNVTLIPAVEATEDHAGNIAHYKCECGKLYLDALCTQLVGEDDVIIRKLPKMLEGKNAKWTKGSTDGLIFRSDADFAELEKVMVDNADLSEDKYTKAEGSTVITLKPEYLETLAAGNHTIAIVSENGTASADFTIEAAAVPGDDAPAQPGNTDKPTSPKTGDTSNIFLWIAVMFVAGAGIFVTAVIEKKKRGHRA